MSRLILLTTLLSWAFVAGEPAGGQVSNSVRTNVTEAGSAGQDSATNAAHFRALVNRQVQAWETRNFAVGAGDWRADGELTSPGGHASVKDLQAAITGYFEHFTDLQVVVKDVFVSSDGSQAAIQWDWIVTRLRDKKRGTTHDAILVRLVDGKIATWSEYFDFGDSVDASP